MLLQGVRGISDLITTNGLINLDFADVKTIMKEKGVALMGTGTASGEARIDEATRLAIHSPLLEEISMAGARGVLINITGSSNIGLSEISDAVSIIRDEAHEDANIIFGAVISEEMEDSVSVTVIATGFGRAESSSFTNREMRLTPRAVPVNEDEDDMEKSLARTVIPSQPSNMNIPAFIRRSQREKNGRHLGLVENFPTESEEDLDIPTFLRK